MTSILIVHPDRKTQRTMQRVLAITGYTVDIADSLAQATERLATSPLLVVIDGKAAVTPEGEAFLAASRAARREAVK